MKLQKRGERLFDGVKTTFYKELMVRELRWRLLVFWIPHINWRRADFDSSSETFDNLRQTNFLDNAVDSPIDSGSNLGVSEYIPNSDSVSS